MISDLIEKTAIIALLNEAIGYAEEAINEIENKTTTTENEDRRKALAEQHIARCEQKIKELNAF